MKRFHYSFTIVPLSGNSEVSTSGIISAENEEIAIIFARDHHRKTTKIFGKAIDIRCFEL
jgi:hypothetical protein|tara:strand:- start:598 stop:777 length:180 start_codon:yes stop_codon:yes gene_type:complete